MSKETRVQFRVTEAKKARFARCAEIVGLKETALGEAAVDALCEYIESHGEITLPLRVIPRAEKKMETAARPSHSTEPFLLNDPTAKPVRYGKPAKHKKL